MAHLESRKGRDKVWRYRVRYRRGGRGTRLIPTPWTACKDEADQEKARIERQLAAEQATPERAASQWLDWAVVVEKWKDYKLGKEKSDRYVVEAHQRLLDLGAAHKWTKTYDVRHTEDLSRYDYKLVRAVCNWAKQRLKQPLPDLVSPDGPRKKRVKHPLLEVPQILKLLEEATAWKADNGAIAHLVAVYGHRAETLVKIRVQDAHLDGKEPFLEGDFKGQGREATRILPRTAALLRPLTEGKQPSDHLFINHLGEPWETGQQFASWFYHNVGKGIGYYRLKNYAITDWFDKGIDAPTVASVTKHVDSRSVEVYKRSNEQRVKKALAVKARSPLMRVPRVPAKDDRKDISA